VQMRKNRTMKITNSTHPNAHQIMSIPPFVHGKGSGFIRSLVGS
jgi:hypothetical protein